MNAIAGARLRLALVAAAAGALAAACAVVFWQRQHPQVVFEMDEDLPRITSGLYPVERAGELTFAWTGERAGVTLAGASRRVAWRCDVRLRGAHPDTVPPAIVVLEIDGRATGPRMLGNEFETVTVVAPARPDASGLRLTLRADPTFVPGPGDRRRLGVQVDEIRCEPDGWTWPSIAGVIPAASAPAAFGVAAALAGGGPALAIGIAVITGAAQAWPMTLGPAPYAPAYRRAVLWVGVWIAMLSAALALLVERRLGRRLSLLELAVLLVPAAMAHLKLVALLHPEKPLIDAVFHAHRLEWVLDGRYLFTQPIQSGVQFPYAIGLYVAALPFIGLTSDYVTLLRLVVVVVDAVACGVLGLMAMRAWRDPLAGAVAALIASVVPLPFDVVGNANLTNAFAQSVALVAIAMIPLVPVGWPVRASMMAWVAVVTLALLSHVSTFALLTFTLAALAGLSIAVGPRERRVTGMVIAAGTAAAVLFSIALYYAHFGESYRTFAAARTSGASAAVAAGSSSPPPVAAPASGRAARAAGATMRAVGVPVLMLGAVGAAALARRRTIDPAVLSIGAWLLAFIVFTAAGTMTAVDPRYVRYADEFISRTLLGTYPAIVLLAAAGVSWAWPLGRVPRLACIVMLGWAVALGASAWVGWLRPA
ncbi:MAG: hypothetical protein IT184_14935 [Acidobacteria bacterium]|nr:hypothetical protein [Acidobacteriota bacterium]